MNSVLTMKNLCFFLGGNDLEMQRIRHILNGQGERWPRVETVDKQLTWNDTRASLYRYEISSAVQNGFRPALVELTIDIPVGGISIDVDHHNKNSGRPASILQVLDLLERRPEYEDLLVAANDSDYIPGMLAMGAGKEDIDRIRRLDRQAQGVTPEMEHAAEVAIKESLRKVGSLVIVNLPHSKASPVTDRLFTSWPNGRENLLLVCEGGAEMNYYGRGDICKQLHEKFGGWSGGSGLGRPDRSAYAGVSDPGLWQEYEREAIKLAEKV